MKSWCEDDSPCLLLTADCCACRQNNKSVLLLKSREPATYNVNKKSKSGGSYLEKLFYKLKNKRECRRVRTDTCSMSKRLILLGSERIANCF